MPYEMRTITNCPNSGSALELFRAALTAEGIEPGLVRVREITSETDAAALHFQGSPSFTAAGQDLFPAASAAALSCRVYPADHGGLSGLPSIDSPRAAVRSAGGTR